MRLSSCPSALPLVLALAACSAAPTGDPPAVDSGAVVPDGGIVGATLHALTPAEHLLRVSMALRGTRPSVDDLAAVQADPAALPGIVDRYLASPEFGVTVRDLHNASLVTMTEVFTLNPVGPLAKYTIDRVKQSTGQEPLRLIEHIVTTDRPYSEILTADYTMADAVVADVWGLPYTSAGDGTDWQVARYRDGRPAAGVLATSGLYLRHRSAGSNYHRGRANLAASAFLCADFLDREVVIEGPIDLADPEAVANALKNNKACASCHDTLDPLAGFFGALVPQINPGLVPGYPLDFYLPARESAWMRTTRVAPTYYGAPAETQRLDGVARAIAKDPRFTRCAARRFHAFFHQIDLADVPDDEARRLDALFVQSGLSAKALARAVVLSDGFKVARSDDDREAESLVGWKKAGPEQLSRAIVDLTGFRWQTELPFKVGNFDLGRVDLAATDTLGFRTLAGGIDSFFVVRPSRAYNATASLFLRALASEAAGFVVEQDLGPGPRRLLLRATAGDTSEDAVRAQLVELHLRLYAAPVAARSPEIDAAYGLFSKALAQSSDPKRAWKVTVSGLLQDLRFAFY